MPTCQRQGSAMCLNHAQQNCYLGRNRQISLHNKPVQTSAVSGCTTKQDLGARPGATELPMAVRHTSWSTDTMHASQHTSPNAALCARPLGAPAARIALQNKHWQGTSEVSKIDKVSHTTRKCAVSNSARRSPDALNSTPHAEFQPNLFDCGNCNLTCQLP